MRNYGLRIEPRKPEDYVFGSSSVPFIAYQPNGDWSSYLPSDEFQSNATCESQSCTSFGTLHCVTTLMRRMNLSTQNFSERFLAKISDTDPYGGNDPTKVAQTLRDKGVVFQERWDFTPDITTPEMFYADIPSHVSDYAEVDFSYDFHHEHVDTDLASLKKAIQASPLGISVAAWHDKGDGTYYRPEGATENHWVCCYGYDDNHWKIFDSYDNTHKLYDINAPITIAKRYHIERRTASPSKRYWFTDIFFSLWELIKDVLTK